MAVLEVDEERGEVGAVAKMSLLTRDDETSPKESQSQEDDLE